MQRSLAKAPLGVLFHILCIAWLRVPWYQRFFFSRWGRSREDESRSGEQNLTRGFFFLVGGEAAKTSREAASKKKLSPTSTTRSDERFSPLASEKTSGIQGRLREL